MKNITVFVLLYWMVTLLSNVVYAEVSVYVPPTPTVNVTVTSGGNLPADTQFCFMFWIGGGSGYYGACGSNVTQQICVNTTSTNRTLHINWEKYYHKVWQERLYFKWESNNTLINETTHEPFYWYSLSSTDSNGHLKWSTRYYQWSTCTGGSLTFTDWHTGGSCGLNDGAVQGTGYYRSKMAQPLIGWDNDSIATGQSSPRISLESLKFDKNWGLACMSLTNDDGVTQNTEMDFINAFRTANLSRYLHYSRAGTAKDKVLMFFGHPTHYDSYVNLTFDQVNLIFVGGQETDMTWQPYGGFVYDSSNIHFTGYLQWVAIRSYYKYSNYMSEGNAHILSNGGIYEDSNFASGGGSFTFYSSTGKRHGGISLKDQAFLQYRYPANNGILQNINLYKTYIYSALGDGGDETIRNYQLENITWNTPYSTSND